MCKRLRLLRNGTEPSVSDRGDIMNRLYKRKQWGQNPKPNEQELWCLHTARDDEIPKRFQAKAYNRK